MLLRQTVAPENGALFRGKHHRVGQRLGTAAEALDQVAQLAPPPPVAQLHLIEAVKQRLPARLSSGRRHGAIDPQPVRQPHQIIEVPQQHPQQTDQQQPGQIAENQTDNQRRQAGQRQLEEQSLPGESFQHGKDSV